MSKISKKHIQIVDLFAGPGGLGEGFSSLKHDPFRIVVSAEMDPHAHATLRLRSFYRSLRRKGGQALRSYYDFCNDGVPLPINATTKGAWEESASEAMQLTLGNESDNGRLDEIIRANEIGESKPWVLIGGPPCQAYSLVGRSRNRGKADYQPENDHRHFLYREYLRIIQKYRPAIFVMENVKGILSSKVDGDLIFHSILTDLADPDAATGRKRSRLGYKIYSLSHDISYERGDDPNSVDVKKFIVKAEDYGIPQARHRVILLGVREDINVDRPCTLTKVAKLRTVREVLSGLPKLRSGLSKQNDDGADWQAAVRIDFEELAAAAQGQGKAEFSELLAEYAISPNSSLTRGGLRVARSLRSNMKMDDLASWYDDPALNVWLNHESRGHMPSDLMRYAFASAYAKEYGRSPKGHEDFDLLEKLKPLHANWESGKFSDRFRVQCFDNPATTVTSHISKDGHYFIHPDPVQCRSLTVREAARLQTFPDNYFFQGNRTQQFHQVGNAVPPLLASKIAEMVFSILGSQTE